MQRCDRCYYYRPARDVPYTAGRCYLAPPTVHMVVMPVPKRNPLMVPASEVGNGEMQFMPQAAMQRPVVENDATCKEWREHVTVDISLRANVAGNAPVSSQSGYSGPLVTR